MVKRNTILIVICMVSPIVLGGCSGSANEVSTTIALPCDPPIHTKCSGANLEGANLSKMDLMFGDFSFANLKGAHMAGSILRNADFSNADLSEAYLAGADLQAANLFQANMSWVNLVGANLRRASLGSADMRYADLTSADLTDVIACKPEGCRGDANGPFPTLEGAVTTGVILNNTVMPDGTIHD